ncbi:MAG: redoxin domain-containing protein [Bacteroidota bacterium]
MDKKLGYYWILLSCFLWSNPSAASEQDSIQVYLFLAEQCPISQYYTRPLRQLYEQFAQQDVQFLGIFSNPDATAKGMAHFQEKYQLPFDLILDKTQRKMEQFSVRVTPEVVVVQGTNQRVIYQGRIDNTYFRVGRRRTVTTTSELRDVLQALTVGSSAVAFAKTQAVGCLITKANAILRNAVMCQPTSIKDTGTPN